jgi:hypothetical protein
MPTTRKLGVVAYRTRGYDSDAGRKVLIVMMMRMTWMANNAIPDSIIINMICRSFVPPVVPKVRSTEVALTSKNTVMILNTINPVTRAFTAMDTTKAVRVTGFTLVLNKYIPDSISRSKMKLNESRLASQKAASSRGYKLKLVYQAKID